MKRDEYTLTNSDADSDIVLEEGEDLGGLEHMSDEDIWGDGRGADNHAPAAKPRMPRNTYVQQRLLSLSTLFLSEDEAADVLLSEGFTPEEVARAQTALARKCAVTPELSEAADALLRGDLYHKCYEAGQYKTCLQILDSIRKGNATDTGDLTGTVTVEFSLAPNGLPPKPRNPDNDDNAGDV
jgi:hypothetical protein